MYSDLCSIVVLYIYLWFLSNSELRVVCTRLSQEVLLSLSTSFSLHRFVCILLRTAFFDLQYMLSLKAKYCFLLWITKVNIPRTEYCFQFWNRQTKILENLFNQGIFSFCWAAISTPCYPRQFNKNKKLLFLCNLATNIKVENSKKRNQILNHFILRHLTKIKFRIASKIFLHK